MLPWTPGLNWSNVQRTNSGSGWPSGGSPGVHGPNSVTAQADEVTVAPRINALNDGAT